MNDAELSKKPARKRQTHGLYTLKKAVKLLGSRVIDRRTRAGKVLAAFKDAIIADQGGVEAISTSKQELIKAAVEVKLIKDSIATYVISLPSIVNRRKRSALPIVKELMDIEKIYAGLLKDIGLERRTKELDLAELLSGKDVNEGSG